MAVKRMKKARNHIPFDITFDILLWLPVSTLARFRRVCKLWRTITRDPSFIDAHLDRARKAHPPSIVLFHPFYTRARMGITILGSDVSLSPNRTLSRPKAKTRRRRRAGPVYLCGSCNGLLCIRDAYESIELLNPATGESLTLPDPSDPYRPCVGPLLGFHPVTKEYKVICFRSNVCEAYTLGTSSWRQICTVDFLPVDPGVTTAKGVMYWLIDEFAGGLYGTVASFDLKDETFSKISPPSRKIYLEKGELITRYRYRLVQLQGSVCCPVYTLDDRFAPRAMDLWMLNEETRSGSIKHEWTRKYSILLPRPYPTPWPILIHDQRILVLDHESKAPRDLTKPKCQLRYHQLNSKSGSLEDDEGEGVYFECIDSFEPFVHVESLVALRNR